MHKLQKFIFSLNEVNNEHLPQAQVRLEAMAQNTDLLCNHKQEKHGLPPACSLPARICWWDKKKKMFAVKRWICQLSAAELSQSTKVRLVFPSVNRKRRAHLHLCNITHLFSSVLWYHWIVHTHAHTHSYTLVRPAGSSKDAYYPLLLLQTAI